MTKDGQHSRLIILFLLGWFLLSHGNLFGRLGLLGGANSSFGCLQIGAGQPIGWPTGVCLTPSVVLCMSKSLRQSIISYQVVLLQVRVVTPILSLWFAGFHLSW
jgi:hypothetical protein